MNYFQSTTDSSRLYRTTTATESDQYVGTVVRGNLADQMNNIMIIRTTYTTNADSNSSMARAE
jgi:hypothetical protein